MNPSETPPVRRCDAPGVCQAGSGCPGPCQRYPFAPGAIQRYARHKRLARRVLLALECAVMAALVLLLGLMSGYFEARGWL